MTPKAIITKVIKKFGYNNQRDSRAIRRNIEESYLLLRTLGFLPRTVIDVGVAKGTPELYRTFPDAYFLLIEPLKEFEPDLISILRHHKGSYVLAAAGSTSNQVIFNVHSDQLEGSSLYKESMGEEADGHTVTVPLVKIDDVIENKQLTGPYLIKIDVQGAELDALEGAQRTLPAAEAVVLEVSLFEFMKGAPQFYDVISYMKSRGYVVYDIILGWNRPLDNALGQVDVVFVKDKGMFRKDHSFSTQAQIKSIFGNH
jgi:FkbM family methyltransferase